MSSPKISQNDSESHSDPVPAEVPKGLEDTFEAIKARHDEISRNIRSVALALMSYALFCFLTLGQSDNIVFKETGQIQIPFSGGIVVNFSTFFIVGPIILIVLTFYLHIFIHELQRCELEASRKLPFVFNLDNWFAKAITFFVFYFLTPLVFLSFIWSIRASEHVTLWSLVALGVCLALVWLFHCATQVQGGSLRRQPFPLMVLVAVFIVSAVPGNLTFVGPIKLVKSDLKNTNFRNFMLDRMNADFAHLEHSDFTRNQNVKHALFNNAFLTNAQFSGANLSQSSFRKCDLTGTRFRGANLNDSVFQEAKLTGSDFSPFTVPAEIEHGGFSFINLFRSDSRKSKARGEVASGLQYGLTAPSSSSPDAENEKGAPKQPDTTSNQSEKLASQSGVSHRTLLKNADFTKAQLNQVNFSSADLEGTRFNISKIEGSIFSNASLLRADFSESMISDSIFQKARMDSTQFVRTEMKNIHFNDAHLAQTVFQNAYLTDVQFKGADLSHSSFAETDFENVDFSHAILEGTDLSGNNFYGVTFENTSMAYALLNLADLTESTALDTDFSGADLSGTLFYRANLTGSRFQNSDLDSVEFTGANLKFADFRNGRNLRDAGGNLQPTISRAENWKKALWDDDIRQELGIDDRTLNRSIMLYVDHHFGNESQEERSRVTRNIQEFYGLVQAPIQQKVLTIRALGRNPDVTSQHRTVPPATNR
ncbi:MULTISPECIES: pentapeptide repeat-containing protein [unclassified Nitrospina]|uniref:pentapeptide repeat-containing protein n=1 Tax=unclassified Nitrospina TaxID=2638683 RepID=UPI003F9C43C5